MIIMECFYHPNTHAHVRTYRSQVPLTTQKKKKKKRSPKKPVGAIPEDVLNRAKELAGDYQKLSKLLRKKAFREVGELINRVNVGAGVECDDNRDGIDLDRKTNKRNERSIQKHFLCTPQACHYCGLSPKDLHPKQKEVVT